MPIRFLVAIVALALPASGQFQTIEIAFDGVGCKPCVDSLPERVRRIRGVESATVDQEGGILSVRLAAANRVRLEQIRDFIEQDGTKARRATVRVAGEMKREGGDMLLQPPTLAAAYVVQSETAPEAGPVIVSGTVSDLHPRSGPIAIRATDIRKPD